MTKVFTLFLFTLFLFSSCASKNKKRPIAISTASSGVISNYSLDFPLYLTNQLEARESVVAKTSDKVFIVHTGHILNPTASKAENEATLESLKDKKIDVVNLSLEDFVVADEQNILFEKYPQTFLNSSVLNLNDNAIIMGTNMTSYIVHGDVILVGLSDKKEKKGTPALKFLVDDYVISILKARKLAYTNEKKLHSMVIIHNLDSEINEIMERLPPNFFTSLAD